MMTTKGLCGLVAAALGWSKVVLTDEFTDLLEENLPSGGGGVRDGVMGEVSVYTLEWGMQQQQQQLLPFTTMCSPQLVLGCEITPMIGTHVPLLTTLQALCPPATAILTLDLCGCPPVLLANTTSPPSGPPSSSSSSSSSMQNNSHLLPPDCHSSRCACHRFLSTASSHGFHTRIARVFTSAEIDLLWHERGVVAVEEEEMCKGTSAQPPRMSCASDYVAMIHLTR